MSLKSRLGSEVAYALNALTLISLTVRQSASDQQGLAFPLAACGELFDELLDLLEETAFGALDESDDDDKKGATDSSRNTGPSLHLLQPFPLGSFNLTAPRLTPEERQAAAKEAIVNDDERAERPSLACVKAHLGHAVFGAFTVLKLRGCD